MGTCLTSCFDILTLCDRIPPNMRNLMSINRSRRNIISSREEGRVRSFHLAA